MPSICIVLHDLRGGGAEKIMIRLANQISKAGHEVTIILVGQGGENVKSLASNVRLIELNCPRTLFAFASLRTTLKRVNPDSILSALTHINVVSFLACSSLGWTKRLNMSERNTFSHDKRVNLSVSMRIAYFIAPYLYNRAKKPIIAVSAGVKQDLIESAGILSSQIVVARNPVLSEDVLCTANVDPSHPWLKTKTQKVIVAVGRLAEQKGYDLLLQAFVKVRKKQKCKLVIFGEGELRSDLTKLIERQGIQADVALPGYSQNPVVEIKAADLFVLSSRFEGSPNALIEAMSTNTPVLAFDCPHGPSEMLNQVKEASLVNYLDVNKLAEKISENLEKRPDTSLYDELVKPYDSKVASDRYLELLLR